VVQVSDGEIKTLLGGFTNSTTFQQNGVTVGGIKYMYLQSDDNQIQGKKGATGVSVAKAGKCESKIVTCLIINLLKGICNAPQVTMGLSSSDMGRIVDHNPTWQTPHDDKYTHTTVLRLCEICPGQPG